MKTKLKFFLICAGFALIPCIVAVSLVAILAISAVGLSELGINEEFAMLIVFLFAGAILGTIYNNLNKE